MKSKAPLNAGIAGRKAANESGTDKVSARKPAGSTKSDGKAAEAAARKSGSDGTRNAAAPPAGAKTAKKPVRPAGKAASRKPTARQALAVTKRLLKDKQERDRQVPAWQDLNSGSGSVLEPGFQSGEARDKALELHAGEASLKSIQGSVSTRDRRNQGKRDKR